MSDVFQSSTPKRMYLVTVRHLGGILEGQDTENGMLAYSAEDAVFQARLNLCTDRNVAGQPTSFPIRVIPQ